MNNLDAKEIAAILKLIRDKEDQFLEHSVDQTKPNPGISTKDLAIYARLKVKLQPEVYTEVMKMESAIERYIEENLDL